MVDTRFIYTNEKWFDSTTDFWSWMQNEKPTGVFKIYDQEPAIIVVQDGVYAKGPSYYDIKEDTVFFYSGNKNSSLSLTEFCNLPNVTDDEAAYYTLKYH